MGAFITLFLIKSMHCLKDGFSGIHGRRFRVYEQPAGIQRVAQNTEFMRQIGLPAVAARVKQLDGFARVLNALEQWQPLARKRSASALNPLNTVQLFVTL